MKAVGGAHCVDDDVREGTRIEALQMDVVAEGGEVAIQSTKLAAAPVVIRVLRRRNRHFHWRAV